VTDSPETPDGLDRRDFLKSLGLAAAAAEAQASVPLGPVATPWDPPDERIAGRMNVTPVPDDFFIPGRFAGKTVIATGSARGMGEVAGRRLAKAGANVVGVDILAQLGASVIDDIKAQGGNLWRA
jgi:hypothetical protein